MAKESRWRSDHSIRAPRCPMSSHLNGQQSVNEEWVIQNYTLESHPFHMHQLHFRDVTKGDGINGRAPLLDTVNVPPAQRGASTEPGVDIPTTPGFVRLRMKFTQAMIG